MDWFSFMFGAVTGVCAVLLIGAAVFYVLLRPYLKAAGKRHGSSAASPPPDLWLKHMKQSWERSETDQ